MAAAPGTLLRRETTRRPGKDLAEIDDDDGKAGPGAERRLLPAPSAVGALAYATGRFQNTPKEQRGKRQGKNTPANEKWPPVKLTDNRAGRKLKRQRRGRKTATLARTDTDAYTHTA